MKKDFEEARHAGLDEGRDDDLPIGKGTRRAAFWLCLVLILVNLPAILRLFAL